MTENVFSNQGMRIQRIQVSGWENAIFGMRLPMNSENKSDSFVNSDKSFFLGERDKDLIIRLTRGGTDHAKVLRMLHVSALVKMPFSWWKHYDTYKVATVAISRSTMHKAIGNQPLTTEDFFFFDTRGKFAIVEKLNDLQELWMKAGTPEDKKHYWNQIIDSIPTAYCQERMIDLNYQTLLLILGSRYQVERLDIPWDFFCEAFLEECPILKDLYEAIKSKRSMTTEEFKKM